MRMWLYVCVRMRVCVYVCVYVCVRMVESVSHSENSVKVRFSARQVHPLKRDDRPALGAKTLLNTQGHPYRSRGASANERARFKRPLPHKPGPITERRLH